MAYVSGMTAERSFTPKLFSFLRELEANNERDWFNANKARYEEDIKEPALDFITDFAPYLEKISPHFVADSRASGGSLFRIYRDVRFSKDKSPYKTHTGMHFRHFMAKDVHAPGFYLHLQPGENYAGIGIWRPDTATAYKIRQAIADDQKAWKRAAHARPFTDVFSMDGESLKRHPKGFDPDHPLIEDLKRKDFIGGTSIPQKTITSSGFVDAFYEICAAGSGYVEFLCKAVGAPF